MIRCEEYFMKKRWFLTFSLFFFLVLIICNPTFAFQNEQAGFRKLKFGMSFQQVTQIVGKDALISIPKTGSKSDSKNPANKYYYLKLNPPMLSNVKTYKLAEIHFFKDQLTGIKIIVHGDKNKYSPEELIEKFYKLGRNMEILYGIPISEELSRLWDGPHTHIYLVCVFNEQNLNDISKDAFEKLDEKGKEFFRNHVLIWIYSPSLRKEQIRHSFEEFKEEQQRNAAQGW